MQMVPSETGNHAETSSTAQRKNRRRPKKGRVVENEDSTSAIAEHGASSTADESEERHERDDEQPYREEGGVEVETGIHKMKKTEEDIVSHLPAQDAVRTMSRRAQEIAVGSKQHVMEVLERTGFRTTADECVTKGKQVLDGVKACQQTAMEVASKTVSLCHEQVDGCADSAMSAVRGAKSVAASSTKRVVETGGELRQRAKNYVEAVKSFGGKITALVEAGRPRLAEVQRTSRRAVGERDVNLLVSAVAQVVGCFLLLVKAACVGVCKVQRVEEAVQRLQKVSYLQRGVSLLGSINPMLLRHIPLIGGRVAAVACAFVAEVKEYTAAGGESAAPEREPEPGCQ